MRDFQPYYAFGVALEAQERWLAQRLSALNPSYPHQLTSWLSTWRANVAATSTTDDSSDRMASLRHSLDWYASLPWYHRFWLRRTTNVDLACRYYAYKSLLDLLSEWRNNKVSATDPIRYQHLQQCYRTIDQRYLATFSWDRLILNWYSKRIASAWEAVMLCHRSHLARNAAMKTQLRYLLTATNQELNSYAQTHWSLRLVFASNAARARQLRLDDLDTLVKARTTIMTAMRQMPQHSGLSALNKDAQAYTRLVYYKLLERALCCCLEQLNTENFLENEFIQAWVQFEKIIIEGSHLAVNKDGQLASGSIWKIYIKLSLQLGDLCSIQLGSTSSHWRTVVYNSCCRIKSIQADWLYQGARWETRHNNPDAKQLVLLADNNTTMAAAETPSAAAEQQYDFNNTIPGRAACRTLGLDPDRPITWNEVRIAYKRLLLAVHPDKQATRLAEERLTEAESVSRSQAVTQAFRCLFDLKEETNGKHNKAAWEDELRQFDQQFQDYVRRFDATVKEIAENREENTLKHRHVLDSIAQLQQSKKELDDDSNSRLARLETALFGQALPQTQETERHDSTCHPSP